MSLAPEVRPVTSTGVDDPVVEPLPSWPPALSPQHLTPPAEVTMHVWYAPAEMAHAPSDTLIGVEEPVVTPLPIWPYPLPPQHETTLSEVSAHVCAMPPADTAVA